MNGTVKARWRHAREILLLPYYRLVLGLIGFLGTTDTIRADIFSALPHVPHLPILWWVVIFLLFLVPCLFEASFRTAQRDRLAGSRIANSRLEGGLGGQASAVGQDGWASAKGGEGGRFAEGLRSGTGGSAEARGLAVYVQGGAGGGAGTPDGRGGVPALGPSERMGGPTRSWRYGMGGAGGNHPEYERRLGVIAQALSDYHTEFPDRARYVNLGIDLPPERWINARLAEAGEPWRVWLHEGRLVLPKLG